jgi:dynactin 4
MPTLGIAQTIEKPIRGSANVNSDEAALATMMLPGRTYPFHLIFSNPLYDPITVRLSVQRSFPAASTASTIQDLTTPTTPAPAAPRRPPYAISLPTTAFPIAAYAEAWEYEDDEDEEMFDEEELGIGSRTPGKSSGKEAGKGKVKSVGVLERRANVTKIGGEVVISKEGKGAVKFNMLVSYTYRADDPGPEEGKDTTTTPSKLATVRKELGNSAGGTESMKTFSFYTVVDLGNIAPKELVARMEKQERRESVQTVGVFNS